MPGVDLFLAWDASWHQDDPKFKVLEDDVEGLRRQAQAVEAGRRIWESWLLSVMGEAIAFDGVSGRARAPADRVGELADIQEQYSQALGGVEVGLGVGMRLQEADEALKAALRRGGAIVFWTEEVRQELVEEKSKEGLAKADPPPGPQQPQAQPAENTPAAGGGFSGATQPMDPAVPQSPMSEASEHSQGEAMASLAETGPSPAERTHAAADFEEQFRGEADRADQEDDEARQADEQTKGIAELKAQVVQVLQKVRAQAKALEMLQATDPQVYEAVRAAIQAMLEMAKGLLSGEPMQKTEDWTEDSLLKSNVFFKETAFRHKESGQVISSGPFHDVFRIPGVDSNTFTGENVNDSLHGWEDGFIGHDGNFYTRDQAAKLAGDPLATTHEDLAEAGLMKKKDEDLGEWRSADGLRIPRSGSLKRKSWNENYYNQLVEVFAAGDRNRLERVRVPVHERHSGHWLAPGPVGPGGRDRRPLYLRMLAGGDQLPPIVVRRSGQGWHIVDGNARMAAAVRYGRVKELDAYELKDRVRKEEEPIEKAKLPLPESAPTKHKMVYPVGAQKDSSPGGTREVGKIKTQSPEDGKVRWREVRAGQVMAPDGTAVSSRNPSGR